MRITVTRDRDPEAARGILAALPEWFGSPSST